MKKIKLYIASSLNGYISKPDGNVDWLDAIPNPKQCDYGYHEFYKSCDITLQGNNTYKFILNSGFDFPYTTTQNYVFTRDKDLKDNKDVSFIKENIAEFVRSLKEEKGKDIWLIGGSQINALFLDHELIDEIWIHVMPVVLDDGIPLFTTLAKDVRLELMSSKPYDTGVVEMKFKVDYE